MMKLKLFIILLWSFLLHWQVSYSQTENKLSIPTVECGLEKEVSIPVYLTNDDDIVATQISMRFPEGLQLPTPLVAEMTDRKDNHAISVKSLGNNEYMFVIFSATNRPLRGNSGILFRIPARVPATWLVNSFHPFEMTQVILSKNNGDNVLTGTESGTMKVIADPRPDITVLDVKVDKNNVSPKEKLNVSWIVRNIGDKATAAGWSEQAILLADNGEQVFLGNLYYDQLLVAGAVASRQAEFALPELPGIDGEVKVQVKLVPSADLGELPVAQNNNTAKSDAYLTVAQLLKLELPVQAIDENNPSPVRCRLFRSGSWGADQTFEISSSNAERITVPSTVTIPSGQSGVIFYANVIDNGNLDTDSVVTVIASGNGYEAVSGNLAIEDNEIPTLTVKASKSDLNEGDAFTLTIERERITASPLTILLTNDHPKRFTYPAQVIIPAGEKNVIVEVTAIDDNLPDVDITAEFTVTAAKHISGKCLVILKDDDVPDISLNITPQKVSEAAGPLAIVAKLSRTTDINSNITVKLSDNSKSDLYYSPIITLPEGVPEAQFTIGVIDNAKVDGDREIDLTAAVYISSCSCSVTGSSTGVVHVKLTILDDDGPALKITSSQNMLLEGKMGNAHLSISRNTSMVQPLTVFLSSDHDSELLYDKVVTIPAGVASVDVTVSAKANETTEGDRTVTITAAAEGYSSGVCWVMITDQTLPDAIISKVELSANEAEAGSKMDIHVTVTNQGTASLPSQSKVNVYLSNSPTVLTTLYTQKVLGVNESEIVTKRVSLPDITGDYTISAIANEDQSVKELLYINNKIENIALKLIPKYTVTVETDKKVYGQGEKVIIKGSAKGSNVANVPVDVYVINEGVRQVLNTITNSEGKFEVVFQLQTYQSGHFIAGACSPNEGLFAEQTSFDAFGLKRTSSDYITCQTLVNEPYVGEIELYNPGLLPLTNVKVDVISVPEKCDAVFEPIAKIVAGGKASLKYTLVGHAATEGNDWEQIKVRIETDESAYLDLTIYSFCRSPKAQLQASIGSINTTMIKGTSRDYQFTITNIGKGETGKVNIALPNNAPWMKLITTKDISSLKQGETTTVILRMTPMDELALNVPVTGQIGINCENGSGIPVVFTIEPVSESTGTLVIDVCDEYTYYTDEAPHLSSAKVTIKHPIIGNVVSEGVTNQQGLYTVEHLPEGYYAIEVSAEKHDTYRNNILVDPGKVTKTTVNLSFQAITYSWDVIETEVQDEYKIITTAKYETNVPVPVVEVLFPKEIPYEDQIFNVIATNKGLIAAKNVTIKLPKIEGMDFRVLSEKVIASLAPQTSVIFQIQLTVGGQQRSLVKIAQPKGSIVGCIAGAIGLYYMWYCGLEEKLGSQLGNYTWGECSGIFGGFMGVSGGPGGSNGPGSPGGDSTDIVNSTLNSNNPTIVRDCRECEGKFKQKFIDCGLGFIPGFGCGWGIGSCFNTWMDEESSDKQRVWCTITSIAGCIPGVDTASGIISCLVGFLDPCDRLMQVPSQHGRSVKTAAEETLPSYITVFQEKIGYAVEEHKEIENVVNNLFGSEEWVACDKDEIDEFYQKFMELTPLDKMISEDDLFPYKPSNISDNVFRLFVERWRNTYLLLNGKTVKSENCLDWGTLDSSMNKISELEERVKSYGYASMSELVTREIISMDDKINDSSSSVCASISLQFSQTMTMTRQAFEGTLTVFNGHESVAMQNVKLNLQVKDSEGKIATSHEFQINNESLDGFEGALAGEWFLEAQQTGKAVIKFVPTKFAAPEEPKEYSFGGTLSYLDPFTGLEVTRNLYPVTLTVKPSPNLDLVYFMQRDVLGDDPLTKDVVEPMVPAEFSLLIHNVGKGEGTNIRMTTEQPEIVANEKSLDIHFELLNSQLNGQEKTLAFGGNVVTEFGNIPANGTAHAQWWFTGTLLGHFVDYDIEATHVSSSGNKDLSLLDTVTVHELIRSVKIPAVDNKVLTGFLVNDILDAEDLPDILYLSDGTTEAVSVTMHTQCVAGGENQYKLSVTPINTGWNYGIISDPTNGRQKLVAITDLSDNSSIDLRNFWQTDRTLRDGKDPLNENRLHFTDRFGATKKEYLLTFEPKPAMILEVESFIDIPTELSKVPVAEVKVRFNKTIDAGTFTAEDITLNCQGKELDASLIRILTKDNQEFTLDLSGLTEGRDGYFVLTVQTKEITDNEGFKGETGKMIGWNQLVGGKVQLTVKVEPVGCGAVSFNPVVIDNKYDYNSVVTLKAEPKEGYDFLSWSYNGEALSTNAEYRYLMLSEKPVTANFKTKLYDVEVTYNKELGTVQNAVVGKLEYGTVLSLTAVPNVEYNFEGWQVNGGLYEKGETLSITVNANLKIEAVFKAIPVIPDVMQTYDLLSGWNWISTNVADKNLNNPIALFAPLEKSVLAVRGQEGELSRENDADLQGSLASIVPTNSYKVKMQQAARLELKGTLFGSMEETITLNPGWNWIGYIPDAEMGVAEALSTLLAEKNEVIKSQEGFALYDGTIWRGSMSTLLPGCGYMYYSNALKSFNYVTDGAGLLQKEKPALVDGWTYNAHKYAENMNIVARLYDGDAMIEAGKFIVGAFAGSECRGIAVEKDGYQFITVHGEKQGEKIAFCAFAVDSEEFFVIKENIDFSGALVGNFTLPLSLHLDANVGIDEYKSGLSVFPNPVKERLFIHGNLRDIRKVRITDMKGSVILVGSSENWEKGIDVSGLTDGVYFVDVQTDAGILQCKFMKVE